MNRFNGCYCKPLFIKIRMQVQELFCLAKNRQSDYCVICLRVEEVFGVSDDHVFDSRGNLNFICEDPWGYIPMSEHFITKHRDYDTRVVGIVKYGTVYIYSRSAPQWYVDILNSGFGYPKPEQLHQMLSEGIKKNLIGV